MYHEKKARILASLKSNCFFSEQKTELGYEFEQLCICYWSLPSSCFEGHAGRYGGIKPPPVPIMDV